MDIKPSELNTWKYWVHLFIIAVIVNLLSLVIYGGTLTTMLIVDALLLVPLLVVGDVVSHTLLGLD